jgi:hypothetical protein
MGKHFSFFLIHGSNSVQPRFKPSLSSPAEIFGWRHALPSVLILPLTPRRNNVGFHCLSPPALLSSDHQAASRTIAVVSCATSFFVASMALTVDPNLRGSGKDLGTFAAASTHTFSQKHAYVDRADRECRPAASA